MSGNGVVKAAMLLMALGPDEAAEAFRHFDPREVRKISTAMAALKSFWAKDSFICSPTSHIDSNEQARSQIPTDERTDHPLTAIVLEC